MIDKNKHYFVQMRPLNIIPFIGFAYTSSSDKTKWVECRVVEDMYTVADGFKVILQSVEEGYGKETYYQDDFESHLKRGIIKPKKD